MSTVGPANANSISGALTLDDVDRMSVEAREMIRRVVTAGAGATPDLILECDEWIASARASVRKSDSALAEYRRSVAEPVGEAQ